MCVRVLDYSAQALLLPALKLGCRKPLTLLKLRVQPEYRNRMRKASNVEVERHARVPRFVLAI